MEESALCQLVDSVKCLPLSMVIDSLLMDLVNYLSLGLGAKVTI